MNERSTEQKQNYFNELVRNLQKEGFTVQPEENGCLPVELDNQPLCIVTAAGGIRCRKDDAASDRRQEALDRIIDIAGITNEYISRMDAAPNLEIESLKGDYRLLADFGDTVLAGHMTKYGAQFITWDCDPGLTSLQQGNYFGPGQGIGSYTAAKQDFAVRSGLLPASRLFTKEQLAVIFDAAQHMTVHDLVSNPEQEKLLEQIVEQIEEAVPEVIDLANELTQYPKQPEQGMQIY